MGRTRFLIVLALAGAFLAAAKTANAGTFGACSAVEFWPEERKALPRKTGVWMRAGGYIAVFDARGTEAPGNLTGVGNLAEWKKQWEQYLSESHPVPAKAKRYTGCSAGQSQDQAKRVAYGQLRVYPQIFEFTDQVAELKWSPTGRSMQAFLDAKYPSRYRQCFSFVKPWLKPGAKMNVYAGPVLSPGFTREQARSADDLVSRANKKYEKELPYGVGPSQDCVEGVTEQEFEVRRHAFLSQLSSGFSLHELAPGSSSTSVANTEPSSAGIVVADASKPAPPKDNRSRPDAALIRPNGTHLKSSPPIGGKPAECTFAAYSKSVAGPTHDGASAEAKVKAIQSKCGAGGTLIGVGAPWCEQNSINRMWTCYKPYRCDTRRPGCKPTASGSASSQ